MNRVRLVGGPYDGQQDVLSIKPPPDVWVFTCSDCGGIHWSDVPDPEDGGEHYIYGPKKGEVRTYIYADLEPDSPAVDRERDLVPA